MINRPQRGASMLLLEGLNPDDLKPPSKNPFLKKRPRATVHRWMIKGKLKAVRVGSTWLTTDKWVDEFIEASTRSGHQLQDLTEQPHLGSRQEDVEAAEEKWSKMQSGKKLGKSSHGKIS